MKKVIFIILIILILVISYYIFYYQKEETEVVEDIVNKEEIFEISLYKIEFVADWSKETHPNNYPSGAHFSPFIAYSHNDLLGSEIFKEGERSSLGVEIMSETGETKVLNEEMDDIISSSFAYKKTQGNVFDSPGNASSNLEFSKNYSYLTFVSMLAPSPDWFVFQKTNLIENGQWVDQIELELVTYDAGSDSGKTLTAQDIDTNPKELISIFPNNLQRLGKIIITKIE